MYKDELRYCHSWGTWLRWDAICWARDDRKLAFHFAREAARDANVDGKAAPAKASTAAGVERFAQADPRLATVSGDWDRDPFKLATPDGTVNLRTGEKEPANPADHITKRTAVAPAPPGTATPLWSKFLHDATKGNADLIAYLKRLFGYCLTGDTSEQMLSFFYGDGGNGKGVIINTVAGIMADYATVAPMETFTSSMGDRHPTELAMLQGARFVTAQETEEGRSFNEVRIKSLTGGDPIGGKISTSTSQHSSSSSLAIISQTSSPSTMRCGGGFRWCHSSTSPQRQIQSSQRSCATNGRASCAGR